MCQVNISSGPCGQLSPNCTRVKLAAILQLSQYCTFDGDSISTVITEPGQPVTSSSPGLGSIQQLSKVGVNKMKMQFKTYKWLIRFLNLCLGNTNRCNVSFHSIRKYENSNNINTTYNIIVTDWLGLTLCTSCVYIFWICAIVNAGYFGRVGHFYSS